MAQLARQAFFNAVQFTTLFGGSSQFTRDYASSSIRGLTNTLLGGSFEHCLAAGGVGADRKLTHLQR